MISNFGEGVLGNYDKEDNIGNIATYSGKGAYGFVFKALDRRNKEYVAIKKVNI